MKRLLSICSVITVLSLFGCPYSSEVPASETESKVREVMLGKFQTSENQATETPSYVEIKQASETTYQITDYSFNSTDSSFSASNYTGFESEIDGVSFFNLMKDGTPPYLIYRVDKITGSSFKLSEVTDNIDEKFEASSDLEAFLSKHKDLSFLYSKDEVTYRKMN